MKIGKFVDVNQNNLEITLKMMGKIPGNLLKNLEKSWNFVSPEKWEPWMDTHPDTEFTVQGPPDMGPHCTSTPR